MCVGEQKIAIGVPIAKKFDKTVYCGEVTRIDDHIHVEYDDGDGNTTLSQSTHHTNVTYPL